MEESPKSTVKRYPHNMNLIIEKYRKLARPATENRTAKAESDATDKFVNLIKKYTVVDRLDAAILKEQIDKAMVHHKELAEGGKVFQQVEIYYRFIGKLEHAAESKKTT